MQEFEREAVELLIKALRTLDCGSNSCRFTLDRTGQRTNSGCMCLKHKLSFPEIITILKFIEEFEREGMWSE
jgi:hypothetical protein